MPLANDPFENLPRRNPYFTGREETFAAIENGFKENSALALTQTIAGLGGVGKSQMVLEYAHRHLTDYADAVWWINAETSLTEDCRRLLLRYDYPEDKDHYDERAVLPALQTWYAEHHNWLLIFDNAEDYDKLEPWLPRNAKGHVLINTRDAKALPFFT